MESALPDELSELWRLVRAVAHLMDRQGELLFRQEIGISLAQFLVLSVIDAHPGPLSQQAVADRLALTKGTVSRQVDVGVAAGLITAEVASHTRRENALALTEQGVALVRRGDEAFQQSRHELRQALDGVDGVDVAATLRSLRVLLAVLEPSSTQPVRT